MATISLPTIHHATYTCLVLAPHTREFEEVRRTIISAASESRVQLIAVDEALPSDFMEVIQSEISRSDLVLAVTSSSNPGVFYEVGLAHAIGKPVIILFDEETQTPLVTGRSNQSLGYKRSTSGLHRLHLLLRKVFEDFRRNPRRFRTSSQGAARSDMLPVIELDRLEPREFENLCFELLNQMGYRRVEWGKELGDVDVVATLSKKDPDGFEYEELWLISLGLRGPPEMLFEMAFRDPEYLMRRMQSSAVLNRSRGRSVADATITLLLIMARDSASAERFEFELRRLEQRLPKRHNPYPLRVRVWDRHHITTLIRQYPQIALKYFSDEGRSQSDSRKSYEQLSVENLTLLKKNQATITALEEERDKRVRAERDAVWKDVAFTAAHKLGNPIFALETNLQALKRSIDGNPAEASDVAEEMGVSIEKAKVIIAQFKSLTKAQEISPRSVEIVPLLKGASRVATDNGVRVKISPDKKSLAALVDPCRITECFDELFANSLHWLKKPEKQIIVTLDAPVKAEIPVLLDSGKAYIRIRFEDNGCGVPLDKKEQIFAPFYTTYPHGTGLGLSLVQRVIERHGGIIREIGKPDVGAAFEIYLPQASAKRSEG